MAISGWRVTGASVPGTSHLNRGKLCEDAHAYRLYGPDLLCIVVADGAGSASRASAGAHAAVQATLDAVEHLLFGQQEPETPDTWQSVLRMICIYARSALVQRAASEFEQTDEQVAHSNLLPHFATTFLVTIVSPHWLAAVQIGDGAIIVQFADKSLVTLTPQRRREYFNETNFLTDNDYLELATYTIRRRADVTGLALLTDGLELLALNMAENTPHAPFFLPFFQFMLQPLALGTDIQRFLASEVVCARTEDDKTLVLAVYTNE